MNAKKTKRKAAGNREDVARNDAERELLWAFRHMSSRHQRDAFYVTALALSVGHFTELADRKSLYKLLPELRETGKAVRHG